MKMTTGTELTNEQMYFRKKIGAFNFTINMNVLAN